MRIQNKNKIFNKKGKQQRIEESFVTITSSWKPLAYVTRSPSKTLQEFKFDFEQSIKTL